MSGVTQDLKVKQTTRQSLPRLDSAYKNLIGKGIVTEAFVGDLRVTWKTLCEIKKKEDKEKADGIVLILIAKGMTDWDIMSLLVNLVDYSLLLIEHRINYCYTRKDSNSKT